MEFVVFLELLELIKCSVFPGLEQGIGPECDKKGKICSDEVV
jgi:hypothetical protein